MDKKINVLQFIVPVGFYGAERWVLALVNNANPEQVRHDLVVTEESDNQDLEIINQFPEGEGKAFKIPMKSKFDWSVIKNLVKIIKDRNIDIIHTHGYKSDILGLIAAKKAGIKCVSTPHGFGQPENFKLKMFVKAGIFSLRFFDQVVPLSKQLQDEVIQFRVNPNKVSYIQNGVDLTEVEKYRQTKSDKQPTEKKKIGFIGQMIPRKNIDDILDVFEIIWQKAPNIELQLLGDGESRAALEDKAKSLKSINDIHFLGFRHDRMDYLKNFDLFVMTSKDEGIPRCLMEAMGMELPVAAYNIKGIDQLVTHEKTGLLSEFGDKETLAEQWLELLNNTDHAKQLSQNAKAFVWEKFSGKRMADEYSELFNNLLVK